MQEFDAGPGWQDMGLGRAREVRRKGALPLENNISPRGLVPSDSAWAELYFKPFRASPAFDFHLNGAVIEAGLMGTEVDQKQLEAAVSAHLRQGTPWPCGAHRPRVSVANAPDMFGNQVSPDALNRVFALFETRHDLDWVLTTKHPERMKEYLASRRMLNNVWVGTVVETQATANSRVPPLQKCNAARRMLVCEPLLGLVHRLDLEGIDWVHVGGEMGPHARPCDLDWIRNIAALCRVANVPCFIRQLGSCPVIAGHPWGPVGSTADEAADAHWAQYFPDLCLREEPRPRDQE